MYAGRLLRFVVLASSAIALTSCAALAPLEVSDAATKGLPELKEKSLKITQGGGGEMPLTLTLAHQPNGFWRVELVEVNEKGKPLRARYGDPKWREWVTDKNKLFTGDRIRVYDIDPSTFGLKEIAAAIGRDTQELRGLLRGRAQQGGKKSVGDLAFFNAGPEPVEPQRFLLITTEFTSRAWNADGEPTEQAASVAVAKQGLAIPAAPGARLAVLVPYGVTIRATDMVFAGDLAGEKNLPPGVKTCREMKDVPKWISESCLANFAERSSGDGTRWQAGFKGLVADDPAQLDAALRKLGRGLLDNEFRRDEAKPKSTDDAGILEGLIRVL